MNVLLTSALLFSNLCAAPGQALDHRLAADPNGLVEITLVSGSVKITGTPSAEVHLRGRLGEGTERLVFERSGSNRIIVRVELPKHSVKLHDADAELILAVPENSGLHVRSVSAPIEITRVFGAMELHSVSGDLQLHSAAPEIQARTVSGAISVEIEGGSLDAKSVSGPIQLRSGRLDRLELNSLSGALTVRSAFAPSGRFELSTHSGAIELTLPPGARVNVLAKTHSGRLRGPFDADIKRTPLPPGSAGNRGPVVPLPPMIQKARYGGGGAQVRLSSFSGAIQLKI